MLLLIMWCVIGRSKALMVDYMAHGSISGGIPVNGQRLQFLRMLTLLHCILGSRC